MSAPRVPLTALRERYLHGGETPPPRLFRALALDPRSSAQALYQKLRARRDARRSEVVRLAALLNFERVLWKAGIRHIAGVDEVGVGPLAGPVVAAAVVLPPDIDLPDVDDSKKLDAPTRERLDREVRARAIAVAVAEVAVEEIDRLNIYHAGIEAMRRAVLGLAVTAEHVLVDAREIKGLGGVPQNAFDKGDGLNYSIACASIVAKVWRDRRMCDLASLHPGYGFERHKGYGTPEHLSAVRRLGPTPLHRKSFPVLRQLLGLAPSAFYEIQSSIGASRTLLELATASARLEGAGSELGDEDTRKLKVFLKRRRDRLAQGVADARRRPR